MKLSRKIPALVLALAMLASLCLTGCQKKQEAAPPDQVAVAIFDLVIRNDASAAKEALGYQNEEDVRRDFMGTEDDFYGTLADTLIQEFESMGATVSEEDGQKLLDGFLTMMNKLEFSASVKSMDEKAGTAVVTCTVSTFPANALSDAVTNSVMGLIADEELLNDTDAMVSAMISALVDAMNSLEPTGDTMEFDTDFVLQQAEVDGVTKPVWIPADAEAFGAAISNAAMGSVSVD